ncbi:hypothetical protein B9Z55_018842 [Caenorhabditis nigoni]|uniref:Uncharacterized protein n=1 Tax=Caenorhabditis nigoni TaxID=1611254 RepID=A0A2G5TFY8_9PELO|nr:hypothetical protein B9Z55_018842 [Caenorhabditis nigoni]
MTTNGIVTAAAGLEAEIALLAVQEAKIRRRARSLEEAAQAPVHLQILRRLHLVVHRIRLALDLVLLNVVKHQSAAVAPVAALKIVTMLVKNG